MQRGLCVGCYLALPCPTPCQARDSVLRLHPTWSLSPSSPPLSPSMSPETGVLPSGMIPAPSLTSGPEPTWHPSSGDPTNSFHQTQGPVGSPSPPLHARPCARSGRSHEQTWTQPGAAGSGAGTLGPGSLSLGRWPAGHHRQPDTVLHRGGTDLRGQGSG